MPRETTTTLPRSLPRESGLTIGKEPRPLYEQQDEVEWYEVNKSKSKLEVTRKTKRGDNKIPSPKDTDQGSRFVVDHVLELVVVQSAFDDKNRKYNEDAGKISDEAWKKAKEAVNGNAPANCKKVAENISKETVFDKVIQGKTDTDLDPKWNEYLKAIKGYLDDFKSKVDTTAKNTGTALKEFTEEDVVATYFSKYCKDKYKEGQDYLQAQLEKGGDEDSAEATVHAKADCDDGVTHSANDLTPIINRLKQQGNGPNNDNCCTLNMGGCQQLEYSGEISLSMCGPGEGPKQCTGCKTVSDALTSFLNECKKDDKVGGKVELTDLEGVTLELGIIRPSGSGRI
ncbi:MAG: hypothetical protein Q9173_003251 [Seirophora scorigena]